MRNLLGFGTLAALMLFLLFTTLFVKPGQLLRPIKAGLRFMFRAFGLKIDVNGLERLTSGRTYIFMMNHISFLDHFLLLAYLPGYFVGLDKAENQKIPLYGRAARRWGQIPIERENHAAALRACDLVKERLAHGVSIAVAPEGTRTPDGRLGPFKKGVFHIAVDSGAAVVPVVIGGLFALVPKGSLCVKPGHVSLRVGHPISAPLPHEPQAHLALSQQVREAMMGLWA